MALWKQRWEQVMLMRGRGESYALGCKICFKNQDARCALKCVVTARVWPSSQFSQASWFWETPPPFTANTTSPQLIGLHAVNWKPKTPLWHLSLSPFLGEKTQAHKPLLMKIRQCEQVALKQSFSAPKLYFKSLQALLASLTVAEAVCTACDTQTGVKPSSWHFVVWESLSFWKTLR